jgi:hypothetical protein
MVRHQVQFVLRFGVFDEFRRLLEQLRSIEQRHDWVEQRCWRSTLGRMNELVIEHEYPDRQAYNVQRDKYRDADDGELTSALSALADLMVAATATETLVEDL